MKHTDIEAIMTAKVAEYAANGYILSTATMSGHQGEVAKVDLKKGNEIIRILLTSESCWDDEGTIQKTVLTVGRAQKQIRMNRPFYTMCATIWNNELDIIEELTWYSVDSSANYFSADKAEIIAQPDGGQGGTPVERTVHQRGRVLWYGVPRTDAQYRA